MAADDRNRGQPMNAGASKGSWALRLSIQLYRRLLVAYPDAFRQEYGAHMVQVFGDCCREAAHTDGVVGLWRYWLITFSDLIVSALAERHQEEMCMSRAVWVRLGSLAAMVGGAAAAIFALFGSIIAGAQLLDEKSPFVRPIFHFQVTVWETTPLLPALYLLALVGLFRQGTSRAGVVGWIGITASVIGVALIAVGNGFWSALVYSQAGECVSPLICSFYDPQHYGTISLYAQFLGMLLLACGMLLYGAVALHQRVLPHWNGAPLLLGLLALLTDASYVFAGLASAGIDYAGGQRLNLAFGLVAFASAATWIALGVALFPRKEASATTQAIPAADSAG